MANYVLLLIAYRFIFPAHRHVTEDYFCTILNCEAFGETDHSNKMAFGDSFQGNFIRGSDIQVSNILGKVAQSWLTLLVLIKNVLRWRMMLVQGKPNYFLVC